MRILPTDILVAAVGRPEFVRRDWVKPGAAVLDVSIVVKGTGEEQRVVGAVAFDEVPLLACPFVQACQIQTNLACECQVAQVAGFISPVPGGVGPMTIAALLHNTLQAARSNLKQ